MKAIGWMIKLILTVMLASAITLVTAFHVMNAYMQELLKPFQASVPQKHLEFSEFVVKLWSQANILGQGGRQQPGKERTPEPDSKETPARPDDAVAAWSQNVSGQAKDKLVLSEEQFLTIRDKLSEADKMAIFSMLVPKLPQEALMQISTKVEGGITSEELAEIEAIVEKHLKPEEFAKLMEIINKY